MKYNDFVFFNKIKETRLLLYMISFLWKRKCLLCIFFGVPLVSVCVCANAKRGKLKAPNRENSKDLLIFITLVKEI